MPIYEYQCLDCHKDHEIIQKISDKPLKKCPSCGGKIKKKLSLSGFQLKGGGWYKDGYSSVTPQPEKSEKKSEKKAEPAKTKTPPTSAKS